MKILLAKNIGFCPGVKRAILIAEKSLKKDLKPIQFLGSLVHNEKVIEKFQKQGIQFKSDFKKIKKGTLIIQAHGSAPFNKKLLEKIIIRDATCPLVKKAQLAANSLLKQGFKVVIIGDKNHDETRGIKGWCQNKALIIENEAEAKKLSNLKKIGMVAQTTQTLEKINRIFKILKNKSEEIKFINTLCPEVQARQKEIGLILKKADGILVIGSKISANTKRLVEIAKKAKKSVWRINSIEELKKIKFNDVSMLGVVSGTSTPGWEIKEIIRVI